METASAGDCDYQHQDFKVCSLDCMKIWPWMRDLPPCVWAGRGWALDENGLRQLPSTGGSAMQGAEVFESRGAAAEEAKATEREILKETAVTVASTEPAAPGEGQKPNCFQRNNLAKQSGVPNISWKNSTQSWEVQFNVSKGKKRRTNRSFAVKKFLGPGHSAEEADAMALEAAKSFRAELVKQGILSEPKVKDPNFTSEVPGVKWNKEQQKWRVMIPQKHNLDKRIDGGYFTEKTAAEAKALELREKHGLQRQVKAVDSLSALPVFHPKVPYPGVKWAQSEQRWHATCTVQGALRHLRVKPCETQGPLGGGAGAVLQGGGGLEEEAGEREGGRKGCDAQGEASKEENLSIEGAEAMYRYCTY